MIHASHTVSEGYCTTCGVMARATNGIPEAPCVSEPEPVVRTPQGHQFESLSGRCARCGAHCMSIDAKLRCV